MDTIRIGVVGDYQDGNETHLALGPAADHAAERAGLRATTTWVATPELDAAAEQVLGDFDALWIAPGSPYRSMRGALEAITYARTSGVPLLGTCGGFQHLIIEFARNVAGIPDAAHAEDDPSASRLLIDKLACSLVGLTMDVALTEGSLAQRAYGTSGATERYYCQFGLNPGYRDSLTGHGLVVSGTDQDGEVRIVELPGHPFFVGTLFVPQTSSAPGAPHPLIGAYLEAASRRVAGVKVAIHGVQPNPNTIPSGNAPASPAGTRDMLSRRSR